MMMMAKPFPCPAILSFPALLQLRQLAACLRGNLGFIRACASHCATVPASVPLCQPMSTAPATYTCSKVSYSVSSSRPEPRSHCHLPHTPSNAHIHFDSSHCQSGSTFINIGFIRPRSHCQLPHTHPTPLHMAHDKEVNAIYLPYTFYCTSLAYRV